jgi:anti-anti-sigma regulatory factor
MKFLFDDHDMIFSLVEEPDAYRLKVERHEISEEHVEEFMDKTVEWLSSNPEKGILIDFEGVTSVCTNFTIQLTRYYEDIKSKGLNVRFVNVAPSVEPYIDVSNITVVMSIPDKPVLSAKELLKDLSDNLTDRQLMQKYSLSQRGLASMFKKLLRKGLISRRLLAKRLGIETYEITTFLEGKTHKASVDAADVLKDIADDVSDADLMKKYRITKKGLQSLFNKLYRRGLVTKATMLRRKKMFG